MKDLRNELAERLGEEAIDRMLDLTLDAALKGDQRARSFFLERIFPKPKSEGRKIYAVRSLLDQLLSDEHDDKIETEDMKD